MHFFQVVYRKKSFLSKESNIEILQGIYFVYKVGIISSYSNITFSRFIAKSSCEVRLALEEFYFCQKVLMVFYIKMLPFL